MSSVETAKIARAWLGYLARRQNRLHQLKTDCSLQGSDSKVGALLTDHEDHPQIAIGLDWISRRQQRVRLFFSGFVALSPADHSQE